MGKLQVTVPGIADSANAAAHVAASGDVSSRNDDGVTLDDDGDASNGVFFAEEVDRSSHSSNRRVSKAAAATASVDVPLCHAEWFRLAPATQAEQDALATRCKIEIAKAQK